MNGKHHHAGCDPGEKYGSGHGDHPAFRAPDQSCVAQSNCLHNQVEMVMETRSLLSGPVRDDELLVDRLAESESYLKTFPDTLPVGVIAVDADDHTILEASRFAECLSNRRGREEVAVCLLGPDLYGDPRPPIFHPRRTKRIERHWG
jgi:hypothetical protein